MTSSIIEGRLPGARPGERGVNSSGQAVDGVVSIRFGSTAIATEREIEITQIELCVDVGVYVVCMVTDRARGGCVPSWQTGEGEK